jgi:putative alpha-1,2-mannosidase
MSAWYIFNSLGFYPVNPASGQYLMGSPLFDEATVTFPQTGRTLTISSPGAPSAPYVKGVAVDGISVASPVLRHSTLMGASSIRFEMSATPEQWAVGTL